MAARQNPERTSARLNTWRSSLPRPTPADWDDLIGDRSVRDFAVAHGLHENRVAEWKQGKACHWALWEVLLFREKRHPDYQVTKRRRPA